MTKKILIRILLCAGAVAGITASRESALKGFNGGTVLDPTATLFGYTLTDMLIQLGQFQASFNDPKYYPNTPFQILYAAKTHPKTVSCPGGGSGIRLDSANAFVVPENTPFFVPLGFVDNAPPVFGIFPTTQATAVDYLFGPASLGATFSITVDGETTPIGPAYLAGPVAFSPPLVDTATAGIQVGAFLRPLTKGHHVVSIGGGYFGAGVNSAFGISCYFQNFAYVVNVVDGH